MSTQIKFKVGDFVRVAKFKAKEDGHDYSGNPKGMIGRIADVGPYPDRWPYKVELEGKAPELFYPDYFAEDELELVDKPSPAMPGIVTTEWGVRSPWGDGASAGHETARVTVKNMRDAGHVDACVIWRGVTEWQVKE